MYSCKTKNRKKQIIIKIDINKVKNKILKIKDQIFNKQKELLEFMEFYGIDNKNDIDLKQMNKEINILNDKLKKSIIIYKEYKNYN